MGCYIAAYFVIFFIDIIPAKSTHTYAHACIVPTNRLKVKNKCGRFKVFLQEWWYFLKEVNFSHSIGCALISHLIGGLPYCSTFSPSHAFSPLLRLSVMSICHIHLSCLSITFVHHVRPSCLSVMSVHKVCLSSLSVTPVCHVHPSRPSAMSITTVCHVCPSRPSFMSVHHVCLSHLSVRSVLQVCP